MLQSVPVAFQESTTQETSELIEAFHEYLKEFPRNIPRRTHLPHLRYPGGDTSNEKYQTFFTSKERLKDITLDNILTNLSSCTDTLPVPYCDLLHLPHGSPYSKAVNLVDLYTLVYPMSMDLILRVVLHHYLDAKLPTGCHFCIEGEEEVRNIPWLLNQFRHDIAILPDKYCDQLGIPSESTYREAADELRDRAARGLIDL